MYLSKIILENFQSFEKGEFVLSPNLNILVGVSNVGKSSVARALSLVLFNKWDKSWVRFGAKYCKVTIQTSTGISVIREKGEKVNRYILFFDGAAAQVYESFGTGVPEPVQQALRIHEVQIDTTDTLNLNLAGQMDALFLLSQTGSYRAKVLGKLSGATYLDHAIRELNKDKRQVTAEKGSKELELVELQEQIDKLSSVEIYKEHISEIETKLNTLSTQEARLERIRELSRRVKAFKVSWGRETQIESLIEQLDLSILNSLTLKVDKIKQIGSLLDKIGNTVLSIEKQNKLQFILDQVNLPSISEFTERIVRINKITNLSNRLNKNQKELVSKTDELAQVEQKYHETKTQYSDMLKQNGTCPLCGVSTGDVCVS
jgi:exonuclease SbcC